MVIPPPLSAVYENCPGYPNSETMVEAEAIGYPKVRLPLSGQESRIAYTVVVLPFTFAVYLYQEKKNQSEKSTLEFSFLAMN